MININSKAVIIHQIIWPLLWLLVLYNSITYLLQNGIHVKVVIPLIVLSLLVYISFHFANLYVDKDKVIISNLFGRHQLSLTDIVSCNITKKVKSPSLYLKFHNKGKIKRVTILLNSAALNNKQLDMFVNQIYELDKKQNKA